MNDARLTCWGGAGAVTGANFLLEIGTRRILVDCGMYQGPQMPSELPEFIYDPESIHFLFVTHAHIDHIGRIHHLVRKGFKGTIYSTKETRELSELMLRDLVHIAGEDPHLVDNALRQWETLSYHTPIHLPLGNGVVVELFDAGHILGSAMYKFTSKAGKSILFTGDLGNTSSTLVSRTEAVTGLDYLLMDSVYGDRNHEPPEERDMKFKRIVTEAVTRGGTLLIPVFSLERTQVMLRQLDKLIEAKELPSVPVFLDSPLAIKITEVYKRAYGEEKFTFPGLIETERGRDSEEIDRTKGAKIILAGSGMSTAGRILHHEALYLPDPKTTILFVGYQSPGTLGRKIEEGVKEVEIDGSMVSVRAHVETIGGFSAHKDSDRLVEFVSHTAQTLTKVFVTMGEPKSSIFLAQRLRDELGVNAVVAEKAKAYELDL